MINLVFTSHMIFKVSKFTGYIAKFARSLKNEAFNMQRLTSVFDNLNP